MNDIGELLAWIEKVAAAPRADAWEMIRASAENDQKSFQEMKTEWERKMVERWD